MAGRAGAAASALVTLVTALLVASAPSAPSAPSPAPVSSPAPAGEPAASVPSGVDVDYQLGGPRRPDRGVGIVVRDRTATPAGVAFDVCYVNGFQTQPDAKRFWRERHPGLLLRDRRGDLVVDENWGEWLLDISTAAKRRQLAGIVGRWTAVCAVDGYDAVEYDNLDSFTRSGGLLSRSDAVAFSRLLTRSAADAGLAAGQKNLAGWDGTTVGFDFVVAEQCGRYRECRAYAADYGDQVLAIEYGDAGFRRACRQYREDWPIVRRDLALRPDGVHRYC